MIVGSYQFPRSKPTNNTQQKELTLPAVEDLRMGTWMAPAGEPGTLGWATATAAPKDGLLALEFGTFLGYSAVKMWRQLGRGSKAPVWIGFLVSSAVGSAVRS